MEIIHRVSINSTTGIESLLISLGMNIKKSTLPGGNYLISFDAAEGNPAWSNISELIRANHAADIYDSFFTNEEILKADWCRLIPTFENGYPQPEKKHAWRQMVYQEQCIICGLGYHQVSPFRIKQEPKFGKNDFISLYWTYAVLAKSNVLDTMMENNIKGFEKWPVILQGTNQPAQTISQVYPLALSAPGLTGGDKAISEICSACGAAKYAIHKHGVLRYKRSSLLADNDIQLTFEWFGVGRFGGFREILISRKLSKLILGQAWQGIRLKPIELI
jgi:hypothetical protein